MAISVWARPEGWEDGIRTAIRVVAEYRSVRLAVYWSRLLLIDSQPIFAVWTVTVLVFAIRHRPARLRRLDSQPGFVACAAAALTMPIAGSLYFFSNKLNFVPGVPLSLRAQVYFSGALAFQKAECGIAIAAVWMVMVLGGRWRPLPNLVERSGQAIGYFWIALIPITMLGNLL
jgi:hypothetical protein